MKVSHRGAEVDFGRVGQEGFIKSLSHIQKLSPEVQIFCFKKHINGTKEELICALKELDFIDDNGGLVESHCNVGDLQKEIDRLVEEIQKE